MARQMINPRRSTMKFADFGATADIVLGAAGVWTEIGSYVVPNGVGLEVGYGELPGQAGAEGRIYALFIDDTAGDTTEEPGLFRVAIHRPDDTPYAIIFEERSEALKTSATDRTQQMPFPATGFIASQDWMIKLFYAPDAAGDSLQYDYTKLIMSVTKYTAVGS